MSYTIGDLTVVGYEPLEVELGAIICTQKNRVGETGTAVLQKIQCPAGAVIEQFGVIVTEALTNAHATNLVLTLQTLAIAGASAVAADTITLPASSAEITLADVRPSGRTITQAVAIGARFVSSGTPINVPPGGAFYLEVTTAAGAAGGAIEPFVVYRTPGLCAAVAASPVTPLAS